MMGVVEAGKPVDPQFGGSRSDAIPHPRRRSADNRFQCKVSTEAKAVHILPVTFLAKEGTSAGERLSAKIRIETDLAGANAADVAVYVQVVLQSRHSHRAVSGGADRNVSPHSSRA